MMIAAPDAGEDTIRKVIDQVAEICLSGEFDDLRKELEIVYLRDNVDDALITAFQDALYAMLAERNEVKAANGLILQK